MGFRVEGLGFKNLGSGFRVEDSGFMVQGSGYRVHSLGSGCRSRNPDPPTPFQILKFTLHCLRSGLRVTSEQKENNIKELKAFYLEAKAIIWP